MGGEFFSMEDERDRWKGRAERAEARADGMERAGAEQARRADENQADMVAWRARAEAAEARVKELEAENHRCWQARDESDRRITQLEADLAAANSAVEDVLPELRNHRKQRDVQVHALVADVVKKAREWRASRNSSPHDQEEAAVDLLDAVDAAAGVTIQPVRTLSKQEAERRACALQDAAIGWVRKIPGRAEGWDAAYAACVSGMMGLEDVAVEPQRPGADEAGGEGAASGPRWDADHLAMAERAIGPWHVDAPAAITHIIAYLRERDQRKG